jgi:DNA-directed RNA polymerase subunit RPC12/RpoP
LPIFDIFCKDCQEENETVGEFDRLKCPHCGSKNIIRRWTIGLNTVKTDNIQGSTPGIRERARQIMKLENEKINSKYY